MPVVAIVAYQGVLADESEAFASLFRAVPGARVITVAAAVGVVAGVGGAPLATATFDDSLNPAVVVVPGGLGSHHHPEVAAWVRTVTPRYILASSTGSALLATSGLLAGRRAATHWLAGPLLERHGVEAVTDRIAVDDPFVTCSGLGSAFDAALIIVRAIGGERMVDHVRAVLAEPEPAPARCGRLGGRWRRRTRRALAPAVDPWTSVDIELEDRPPDR